MACFRQSTTCRKAIGELNKLAQSTGKPISIGVGHIDKYDGGSSFPRFDANGFHSADILVDPSTFAAAGVNAGNIGYNWSVSLVHEIGHVLGAVEAYSLGMRPMDGKFVVFHYQVALGWENRIRSEYISAGSTVITGLRSAQTHTSK
jgi:hypothetical protein